MEKLYKADQHNTRSKFIEVNVDASIPLGTLNNQGNVTKQGEILITWGMLQIALLYKKKRINYFTYVL